MAAAEIDVLSALGVGGGREEVGGGIDGAVVVYARGEEVRGAFLGAGGVDG